MTTKTLDQLVEDIKDFNHARGWHQHPEDNAKSIVIEAAELLEHFQWDVSTGEVNNKLANKDLVEIKKEVADVFWYLIGFCTEASIDLRDAIEIKYAHNAKKYPVEKFKGHDNIEFRRYQHRLYHQKNK